MFPKMTQFLRRKASAESSGTELLLPPKIPLEPVFPEQREVAEHRTRRIAEKAGSILGGAIAGFTSGVAKHTVAPVARGTMDVARGTVGFVKSILVGLFVVIIAIIGLLAIILNSAPRH